MTEPGGSNTPSDPVHQLEDDASFLRTVAQLHLAVGHGAAADRLNGIAAALIVMPADQWTAARRFFG